MDDCTDDAGFSALSHRENASFDQPYQQPSSPGIFNDPRYANSNSENVHYSTDASGSPFCTTDNNDTDDEDDYEDDRKRFSYSSCQSRTEDYSDGTARDILDQDDTDIDTPTPKNDDDVSITELACNDNQATPTSPLIPSPNINIPGSQKGAKFDGICSNSLPDFELNKNLYSTSIDIGENSNLSCISDVDDRLGDSFVKISINEASLASDDGISQSEGYIIDDTNEYFGVWEDGSLQSSISSSNSSFPNAIQPEGKVSSIKLAFTLPGDKTDKSCDQHSSNPCTTAEVCSESVIWLSHRLGPVLTAKYLTRNLLKMLTLCYLPDTGALTPVSSDTIDDALSVTRKKIQGDLASLRVLDCLSEVACLYGEQVIMKQYITHICDLIANCRRRSVKIETKQYLY